jgi:hypothetical protein
MKRNQHYTDKFEKYTCDCSSVYHGQRCEHIVDACFDNPCQHHGQCQALSDGHFQCSCSSGYTGQRCEVNIDDCQSHRCLNNGTCIDQINEYTCSCSMFSTGESTMILLNERCMNENIVIF